MVSQEKIMYTVKTFLNYGDCAEWFDGTLFLECSEYTLADIVARLKEMKANPQESGESRDYVIDFVA